MVITSADCTMMIVSFRFLLFDDTLFALRLIYLDLMKQARMHLCYHAMHDVSIG